MMERRTRKTLDWKERRARQERAREWGEEIVHEQLGAVSAPIDPLALVREEGPRLKALGADFKERFDGQLEYHQKQRRFLLFFNTKYDQGPHTGEHHPRTRFSISHELGHYYLDSHRKYLVDGGKPHGSRSEFTSDSVVEAEADSFASGLLMPSRLLGPLVNQGQLSRRRVETIAETFQTSILSTGIRSVQISHFPCAFVAIREGRIAWRFQSEALIEAKCYPGKRELVSPSAVSAWEEFRTLGTTNLTAEGRVTDWFQTYGRDFDEVLVREEYIAIPVMETVVVLLTADEEDLFPE